MWITWNKLFGWDYVSIENNASSRIKRVHKLPIGNLIKAYTFQQWVIPDLIPLEGIVVHGWTVKPLTIGILLEIDDE